MRKSERRRKGSEKERFVKQAINIAATIFIYNSTRKNKKGEGEVREKDLLKRERFIKQAINIATTIIIHNSTRKRGMK